MNKIDVINRTFVFIHNIPADFIDQIWSENPWMAEHLKSKFTGFCLREGYASANAILKFFAALDESNSEKFCSYAASWIQQHD